MLHRDDPFDTGSRSFAHPFGAAIGSADEPPRRKDDRPKDPGRDGGRSDTATITKPQTKGKRPNLYRVLLLNDDYTPMEFVVLILQDVFNKTREEAMRVMLHVHNHGVGECGVFPYEVAETKVTRVMDAARKNQHPLQCVMEKQ
ncbi:ATP-dependent Clp protease adapter ClpS [Devosia sp.]|uniref:ATP-dependent Clp protease adapter ClpS n=1 Tax=Devosia sp. TaxID=1871048 RepID=UPI0035B1968A